MPYFKTVFISFLLLFVVQSHGQAVFINEMMASNDNFLLDEDGDDSDWIEIYNASAQPVSLSDFYLSDKEEDLLMWPFPDIEIGPHEFLLVFASGKDRRTAGEELHTNFSINKGGEALFLSTQDGVVHSVPPVALATNISYGLYPDGGTLFTTYSFPTPGFSNVSLGAHDQIVFSVPGGIYTDSVLLEIFNTDTAYTVHYTLDGTPPDSHSQVYDGSVLTLDNSMCSQAQISHIQISPDDYNFIPQNHTPGAIVIRAASFDSNGQRVSPIETNTYFIEPLGVAHSLPVVSISASFEDLFDHETGIFAKGIFWDPSNPKWSGNYYQRGREWEREVFLEIYEEPGQKAIRQNCGLRVHGNISRRFQQKGLRLYARSDYGINEFNHPLLEGKPMETYKRLVLKPLMASFSHVGSEDYFSLKMAQKLGLDAPDTRAVVVYINGEYWGIYFLQERLDDRFIENNFDIHHDSVDLIEDWQGSIQDGCNEDFLDLYAFVKAHDLSLPLNYEKLKKRMDIDNFIDYQIFQIVIGNYDWPANNMKCWRERKEGALWRWIFFDGDAALGNLDFNTFEHALSESQDHWPTNAQSTLFFRKLMQNDTFELHFFDRLQVLLKEDLFVDSIALIHNNSVFQLRDEIFYQINRYGAPKSYSHWSERVESQSTFVQLRACKIAEQVEEMFGYTIEVPECIDEGINISNMLIYPNPSEGDIHLSFESDKITYGRIRITNVKGQILLEQGLLISHGKNLVPFSNLNLTNGVYFVNVVTKSGLFQAKMLFLKK